ncbi:MAG: hypothetical protein HY536_02095 [Candidatus Colwellbacteria bacterium]|nr:hypothetical protein [Candidatus Colwellbacteria bacterium]
MKPSPASEEYLEQLKKRSQGSRVYTRHQLIGLMAAELLHDEEHTSLYIKLAKEHDEGRLLSLAERVASDPKVREKGAYFMRVWHTEYGSTDHRKQGKRKKAA